MPDSDPIAIFGGTFNPIHFGHLRSALELVEALSLRELRFVPAASPPHRRAPGVSAAHRAAMVEAAIAGEERFLCDRRELRRDGPSYTYDTLLSLREEIGARRPLILTVGSDAVLSLDTWYRWRELLDVAHLLVLARPGWTLPSEGVVADTLRRRQGEEQALRSTPAGVVLSRVLRPLHVASTDIRALLQSGRSARYLTPDAVLAYIREHGLYGAA
jgi:nicotinate-nucleotide adenylyltransferase